MSGDQTAGHNHNMKIDNSSFERLEQFRYWEKNLMDRNSIHKEIKSKLKSENACYRSAQNLLSFNLLLKNIKIRRTIILSHRFVWV
jgi:hypothetical protein